MSPTVTTGRVYHSNPIGSANRRVTPLHMPSADATELYRGMSKDEARIELRSWKRYVDKYNEEYNRQLSLIQILKAEYEDKDAAKIVAIAVGDDASVPTAVTSGAAAQQGTLDDIAQDRSIKLRTATAFRKHVQELDHKDI